MTEHPDHLENPYHPLRATVATRAEGAGDTQPYSPPTAPIWVGRYRLGKILGQGGMGTVFEAEQENPRRTVALKLLRPALASPTAFDRFKQEAQALAAVAHPAIATIYEAGVENQPVGGTIAFIAMELVRGALPLDRYAAASNLNLAERAALLGTVCEAIEFAHSQGIIHRDLKPGNILVDVCGNPKVIDFGIALLARPDGRAQPTSRHTTAGEAVGTREYMSPEQIAGEAEWVDGRTDVYALGVVLYELCCGGMPFDFTGKTDLEIMTLIREVEPPSPAARCPDLPRDLDTIIRRAMSKDPRRRYGSPAALAADLGRWIRHEPIDARTDSPLYVAGKTLTRSVGRRPLAWTALAVAAITALAVTIIPDIVHRWTPIDRWFGRFMHTAFPFRPAFHHTRLLAITESTDGPALGRLLGIDNIPAEVDRSWRRLDAAMLNRFAGLAERGSPAPRAVAFDSTYSPSDFDMEMSAAIHRARAAGIPVILARFSWDTATWTAPGEWAAFYDESGSGCALGQPQSADRYGLEAAVWSRDGTGTAAWFMHAYSAARRPKDDRHFTRNPAGLELTWTDLALRTLVGGSEVVPMVFARPDPRDLSEGVRPDDLFAVYSVRIPASSYMDSQRIDYAEALTVPEPRLSESVGGRVVIVGDIRRRERDDWSTFPDLGIDVPGCDVQTVAIEGLLAGRPTRELGPVASAALMAGFGGLGLLSGFARWARRRPLAALALLTLGTGVVTVVLDLSGRMFLNPVTSSAAAALALGAGLWIARTRDEMRVPSSGRAPSYTRPAAAASAGLA